MGFKVDILKYGMNVVMDVINLSVDLHERGHNETADYIDLSEPVEMEG